MALSGLVTHCLTVTYYSVYTKQQDEWDLLNIPNIIMETFVFPIFTYFTTYFTFLIDGLNPNIFLQLWFDILRMSECCFDKQVIGTKTNE